MKKKIISILLATTLTAAVFAGCGSGSAMTSAPSASAGSEAAGTAASQEASSQAAASTEEASTSEEPIPFTVIGWNANIAHLDSAIAYSAGFYEKEGLDISYTWNNSNPDNIQAQMASKADMTSAGATAVLQYINEGADLVIIGGQMSLGETLYARPERAAEFTDLYNEETLAGKKIGVSRMNTGDIAFRKILIDKGIDLSKIEFVELDSQATVTEAVIKGEVDLGINFLTFRATAEAQGLVPISQLDSEDEWTNYICCRTFTTSDKLAANRDAYVKALKANIEAYALIQTDKEATFDAAQKVLEIDEDVLYNQIYEYGHLGLSPNPDKLNTTKFFDAMVEIGYIDKNVDIADHIDTSVYIDALNELLEEDPDNAVYKQLKADSDATNL